MSTAARRIGAASVVAAFIVATASAAVFAQSPVETEKVVFTYGTQSDIDSFNPLVGAEAPAYTSFALQYNLLLDFSPEDLSPIPGIATEVPTQANGGISPDGLTWTYTIREGMTWSDGVPLTAADVAFTYNYILDHEFACCTRYLKFVDSVRAPTPTELVIHTTQPTAGLLSIYDYILPQHIWQDIDQETARIFQNYPDPVTSGPFHLVDWEQGVSWTFEANDEYWAGAPNVDEIVFRVYPDQDALVAALRSGEIDFADDVQPDLFDALKGRPDIATNAAVTSDVIWVGINTGARATIPKADGNPALEDVDLRRALAMAVDKQELVDRVELGHATPGTSIIPPTAAAFHYEPGAEEIIPFDIEGANALLDQSGYADADGDGVREDPTTGDPLSFRLFSRTEREDTHMVGDYLVAWWGQIGVEVEETPLTDKELANAIFSGDFDMFIWGWIADPDPDFLLSVLTSDQRPPSGIWSDTFYSDPGYDQAYLQQKAILDRAERAALVRDMQATIYDDVPYIVLFYDDVLQAYRSDRWTGFTPQPTDHGDLLAPYGPYSFIGIEAVERGGGDGGGDGGSAGIVVGALAAAVVAIGAVVLLARRRGSEDGRT